MNEWKSISHTSEFHIVNSLRAKDYTFKPRYLLSTTVGEVFRAVKNYIAG
jgi:hypothetical protein